MARSQESQRQRTQNNPFVLGSFDTTSLRYLKGELGPTNQLVGRADTGLLSNGGFGGGTYNHWFQVNLIRSGWIIVAKAGPRPKYIQVSVYDLNKNPIEGRAIFEADSLSIPRGSGDYYPYLDTVMGAQSDLYNTFMPGRLDLGDERYYPLPPGPYLLCISTTRNERLSYEVGLVIEFQQTEVFIELEDSDNSFFLTEDGFNILGEPVSDLYFDSIHDHSLSSWKASWAATHQDTDKFPDVFIPLTNRP